MINNVVLVGRVTRDPELRYTPSNVAVATFNLAVNRNFKGSNGELSLIHILLQLSQQFQRNQQHQVLIQRFLKLQLLQLLQLNQ